MYIICVYLRGSVFPVWLLNSGWTKFRSFSAIKVSVFLIIVQHKPDPYRSASTPASAHPSFRPPPLHIIFPYNYGSNSRASSATDNRLDCAVRWNFNRLKVVRLLSICPWSSSWWRPTEADDGCCGGWKWSLSCPAPGHSVFA